MAARAATAAVAQQTIGWQEELAAVQGSSQWQQLLLGLAAVAGGPSVASLLRRAAASMVPGHGSSGSPAKLAQAVQQVAWEKLHTGDWHAVEVAWRDCYSAACILAAAAGLPGGEEEQGLAEQPRAAGSLAAGSVAGGAGELRAALWHLDMAAIMGGPLLRPAADAFIATLQPRWQHLHSANAGAPAPAAMEGVPAAAAGGVVPQTQQGMVAAAAEAGEDVPAVPKRRRLIGTEEAASLGNSAPATSSADMALLPPWSLGPRGAPVATAELPSLEAFWQQYMSAGTPVLISGAMKDWPALTRWADPAYLVAVAGPRTVPVEVGKHYLAEQWGQQLMTLQRFVEQHILGQASTHATPPGSGATKASGCDANASTMQHGAEQPSSVSQAPAQRGYLAQHPLFDQIPALAADTREPPYCCLGEGEVQSINAWFGPAGTVTPLHTDPHANLLCQAVGRKYVRLYAPSCTAAMYPHAEGMHGNSGQVDVDAPDLQQFPLFGGAAFQDCILEPGHMLFIPPGWWHYVKSLSVSFSVSYWWR